MKSHIPYSTRCFIYHNVLKENWAFFLFIRNHYIRNWQVAFQKIVLNTLINGVGIAYIILNDEYKAKKTKVFSFTYVDGSFIFFVKIMFLIEYPFYRPCQNCPYYLWNFYKLGVCLLSYEQTCTKVYAFI